jgi:hypothetical protein
MSSVAETKDPGSTSGGGGSKSIELPAPTIWPLVTALGITLTFAGMVTVPAIGAIGLLLTLVGGVGWWRTVLPSEDVEDVPLRPPAERALPIVPVPQAVEHLKVGVAGHRQRLPVSVTPFSAGVAGGVVGSIAMAIVACMYGWLIEDSVWYPINLAAGVLSPALAAADPGRLAAFSATNLVVATGVHGALSVLMGVLYAVILPMLPGRTTLWGGVVAPLLWTGLIWSFLGILNPALNERIAWSWFVASQLAFGVTVGIVVARAERIPTMQAWSLSVRAGIEAPRPDDADDDGSDDAPSGEGA